VDNYTEGIAVMIIGMGVVFITLAVLATFTGALERLFRPREDRLLEMSHENLHDEAGTELEELAIAAVAVHLMNLQKQQVYAPLARVSEQWKLVGRFKSLRR
jgi:Na+-transporting methylmalonyl-CoA/oxaloacetate decarboxylase gamma subunit